MTSLCLSILFVNEVVAVKCPACCHCSTQRTSNNGIFYPYIKAISTFSLRLDPAITFSSSLQTELNPLYCTFNNININNDDDSTKTQHLLITYYMTGSKHVIWINSFSPHNNPMSSVLLCFAFCLWRNWGTRSLNYLLKISRGVSSPVFQSTLGFTPWWLDHITMQRPAYGFPFHGILGFPEIRTKCYSCLYSLGLAQSRCSLNWKWNKIDSSCRDNRQWGFNTKSSELRRWLPRSECGRARHHLTRKGRSQTGTKQRQGQCRRDNQNQSKTKAPTHNSSLSPATGA